MLTETQEKTTIWGLQRMCERKPPNQIVFTSENNSEGYSLVQFNLTFDSIMCQTYPHVIALYNSNSSGKMCMSFHSIEEIYIESFGDYWRTVTIICKDINSNRKKYTVIFKY